ncbi:hypothetical protein PR048_004501 [Dryococelus australis]|uniref:Uncharacterized protein n=1 Tax=Dryococelus australis TaxID=614101 RepID=A0ABQ9I5M4_9NEOP|nr:hypothetical protein PR048_004501 [Dryococelus australis]
MPLVGGFSRRSPVSPAPSFWRRSILTSITLIGSQDLASEVTSNGLTDGGDVDLCRPPSWTGSLVSVSSRASRGSRRQRRQSYLSTETSGRNDVWKEDYLSPSSLSGVHSGLTQPRRRGTDQSRLVVTSPGAFLVVQPLTKLPDVVRRQVVPIVVISCPAGTRDAGPRLPTSIRPRVVAQQRTDAQQRRVFSMRGNCLIPGNRGNILQVAGFESETLRCPSTLTCITKRVLKVEQPLWRGEDEYLSKTRRSLAASTMFPTREVLELDQSVSKRILQTPPVDYSRRHYARQNRHFGAALVTKGKNGVFQSSLPRKVVSDGPGMERRWYVMAGEGGVPRGGPPASGIVQHDSQMRGSGRGPAEDRARVALVGGECASHCATAAPLSL